MAEQLRFSDWRPLNDAENQAPPESGLFQLKIREGLLSYPNGKSAMFYYGFAGDLNQGLGYFRRAVLPILEVAEDALYVRWLATEDTDKRFQNHLNTFHTQFGTLPLGNEMLLHKQNQDRNPSA